MPGGQLTDFPDHPFWDFSAALYGRPGVADACIRLQDECGLDVNLLLFACWLENSGGGRLSGANWRRLINGTESWRREVVEPMRRVRRHLKSLDSPPQAASLRKRVLALELDAEHAEQLAIVELARPMMGGQTGAAGTPAALEDYAAAAGVTLSEAAKGDIGLLGRESAGI